MKKSDYFEHLQPIPYEDIEEDSYEIVKGSLYNQLQRDKRLFKDWTAQNCVNRALHDLDYYMNQNGMEKAIYIITAMLFQIELDEVDEQLAYEAHCDVTDLETGQYDHLFQEEDLPMLKEDMRIVREYLNKHPRLCEL